MRKSIIIALIVCLASVSLAIGVGGGCSKKKKSPFWIPPTSGPGAGGGPISGTFAFKAIEADTKDPIPGVSVHVDAANVSDTQVTDADGEAVFTVATGPIDVTFWRSAAAKITLFNFDHAKLTFPFPAPDPGGGGTIDVDVTISGVNILGGDLAGYLVVVAGNNSYSNSMFMVSGTTTSPSPITVQLPLGKPTILMAIVGGINLLTLQPEITKYGIDTYPTGVASGTTDITLKVSSASGIVPFTFSGTIDQSDLTFSPASGAATILCDFGSDGIFPVGAGTVDLGLDTFDGNGIRFSKYNRYGFMVAVGDFDNGMSATLQWGTYSAIETIAGSLVTLHDAPALTAPTGGAVGLSVTPTVSWNAAGAGSGTNYYFVTIQQISPLYNWVGIIPAGTTTVTVPADASLDASTVATINVIGITLDGFDYSTIDPEELLLDATYLGTSGQASVTTAP